MNGVTIRRIAEADCASFRAAVDVVAREKRYLAAVEAPDLEQTTAFVRSNLESGNPQFVAVQEQRVIGWCDVVRVTGQPIFLHRGTLGMGIVPEARGQGIGRSLIEITLAEALALGMTRIELVVRADNEIAQRLYERMGFRLEGHHSRTDYIDGIYYDTRSMALLAE